MAEVRLNSLVKRYGQTPVVHGIDLEIDDREFIVLVGPSGCGKSTILRMVAGLETISGGEISIGGRVVNDVSPKKRHVAMVFQNYALYPHMSVFENMGFGLEMSGCGREEIGRKVREAADILELGDYLKRKPAALSGGQRQRVAMGRAIVRRPDVFLFDEPLSNLDAQLRTQMRMELKKMHMRFQTTTIYVTHDQIEAMTLADRIVVLEGGRIRQVGTPIEVFERPQNVFVAKFIGNPPMNIFEAEYGEAGGERFIAAGDFRLPLSPGEGKGLADGEPVLAGVRPDAVKRGYALERVPENRRMTAKVDVAEILGGQSLLALEAAGVFLIAEAPGRVPARPGEQMEIGFEPDRLVLFDPETTEAVA